MEKDRDLSLVKRVVVGIIFVPVIAWIFLSGEWPLYIFLVLITVVGQWEMYNMFSYKLRFPHQIVGFSAGYAIVTDAFLTNSIYLFTILSWNIKQHTCLYNLQTFIHHSCGINRIFDTHWPCRMIE